MAVSDLPEPKALHRVPRIAAVLLLGVAAVGCDGPESGGTPATATECVPGGELVASLYGHREGDLDWRAGDLRCEGMPRPHGQGARLRFEGPAPGDGEASRLAFIIALRDLARGQTATGLSAVVTLMQVGEGQFFTSPEQAGCFADVESHERLDAAEWRISGLIYCVSPLAEINGASSVSLGDLRFTGRLDWSEPE